LPANQWRFGGVKTFAFAASLYPSQSTTANSDFKMGRLFAFFVLLIVQYWLSSRGALARSISWLDSLEVLENADKPLFRISKRLLPLCTNCKDLWMLRIEY
jgi:hypothetical protein